MIFVQLFEIKTDFPNMLNPIFLELVVFSVCDFYIGQNKFFFLKQARKVLMHYIFINNKKGKARQNFEVLLTFFSAIDHET